MLHILAYVVIGLVFGWLLSRGAKKPAMSIIWGLIGGLVGGLLLRIFGSGYFLSYWGSLAAAAILALILAAVGRGGVKA